jgi:multiple sugar transport system substrate-binding protein
MEKMKKSHFAIIPVVVLLVVLLLASCSGQTKDAAPSDSSNASQDTPKDAAKEPAELVFYSWSNAPEESFNSLYGNSIRAKFPNYTIKYVQRGDMSVQDLLSSGQRVDIYFDSIGNFANTSILNNMQYDMTELVKKHNIDLNQYEPTSLAGMKQMSDGKLYGLPISNVTLLLYYNKGVFDKFGVPYPKNGMTWDDTFALAKKLTRVDNGVQYQGLSFTQAHPIRMNSLSLPLIDPKTGKAGINTDNWKKIFQMSFIDLYLDLDPANRQKAKINCSGALEGTQDLAMCVDLSSNPVTQVEALSKISWDMVALPTFKELPGVGAQMYPTYFSITSMAKNKDAAMEVIKFLSTDAYQVEASKNGNMPGVKSEAARKVLGQNTAFKDKNFQAVYFDKAAPIASKNVYDYAIEKVYVKDITNLVQGKVDLNTFLRDAEERGNQFLKEQTGK